MPKVVKATKKSSKTDRGRTATPKKVPKKKVDKKAAVGRTAKSKKPSKTKKSAKQRPALSVKQPVVTKKTSTSGAKKSSVRKKTSFAAKLAKTTTAAKTDTVKQNTIKAKNAVTKTGSLTSASFQQQPRIGIHQVIMQTARFGGLALACVGALGGVFYSEALLQATTQSAAIENAYTLEQMSQTTNPISSDESSYETVTTDPAVVEFITIASTDNPHLRQVTIQTTAQQVKLFLQQANKTPVLLGEPKQNSDHSWQYSLLVDTLEPSIAYTVKAKLYFSSDTYRWLTSDSFLIPNTADTTTATTIEESAESTHNPISTDEINEIVDQTDPVTVTDDAQLTAPTIVVKSADTLREDVVTEVLFDREAEKVQLLLRNLETQVTSPVGTAEKKQTGVWKLLWNTDEFINGNYNLLARVSTVTKTYFSSPQRVTIENVILENSLADKEVELTSDVAVNDEPVILPKLSLIGDFSQPLTGKVSLTASIPAAKYVHFYSIDTMSATHKYLGSATKVLPDKWNFQWQTTNTPNGEYLVLARAATAYGTIESNKKMLLVKNVVASEIKPEVVKIIDSINVTRDSVEADTTMDRLLISPISANQSTSTSNASESNDSSRIKMLLNENKGRIQSELDRLTVAYRSGDIDAQTRVNNRLVSLFNEFSTTDIVQTDKNKLLTQLNDELDTIVNSHKQSIDRVDKVLSERQQKDFLADSDNDGISDYDEVTIYASDPFNPDSDNDGFNDGAEVLGGFDPLNDARETTIAYESPRETGVVRSDVFKVTSVTAKPSNQAPGTTSSSSLATPSSTVALITGEALPNSFVTIYIFSTPVVVTIKANDDGSWQYEFDQELEDGEHNVYVGITDNAGKIIAKSEPFTFIKTAQAISPAEVAALNTNPPTTDGALLSNYTFLIAASFSLVTIGLTLILLGWYVDRRRPQKSTLATTSTTV